MYHKFLAAASDRLDLTLANYTETLDPLERLSRSAAQQLIRSGSVSVDGKVCTKPSLKLAIGVEIQFTIQTNTDLLLRPYERSQEIAQTFSVVYEDQHLLVINKPAGLAVHAGAGAVKVTLVDQLCSYLGSEFSDRFLATPAPDPTESSFFTASTGLDQQRYFRPGIVHRLDSDTTGLMVVAKHPAVLTQLSAQFQKKTARREYLAIVAGSPRRNRGVVEQREEGVVSNLLARDPKNRLKFAVVAAGGKPAITNWSVLRRSEYAHLVRVKLATGRTHQIRVHLAFLGTPVFGDRTYGNFSYLPINLRTKSENFGRQALHATKLTLIHPVTGAVLECEAEPPDDFRELMRFLSLN